MVAIASGGCHGLALRADGTVWGWGCDSDWELGAAPPGGGMITSTPIQATGLDRVQGIATGSDHGLAVRSDGTVWAWGKNDHGQVGVPQGENCSHHPRPCVQVPVAVPGLSGVKTVAAAGDSSFALDEDGSVWAWGANESGQLGTGTTDDLPSPTRVEALTDITSLSATGTSGVAVQADGTVWEWGGNEGLATPVRVSGLDEVVAVAAGLTRNVALKADGSIWAWGERDQPVPARVEGLGPVIAVVGGGLLSGSVAADGTVWTWGLNYSAKPEPPTQADGLSDVTTINMGGETNLALKADGTVWEWNQYGHPRPVPAPDA